MNDTTKKILILAAVFAAIFLIAKRQGKDAAKKSDFYDPFHDPLSALNW